MAVESTKVLNHHFTYVHCGMILDPCYGNWLGWRRTMTFERRNADYRFWMTHIIWRKNLQINGAGMSFIVKPA